MSSISSLIGFGVGFILVIIPEPATTILGLGMMAFTAYKAGWMGGV
jgi:hypothetical protein